MDSNFMWLRPSLSLNALACLLRWWPRRRTSLASLRCFPSPWACSILVQGPKDEYQAHDDNTAFGRNSGNLSRWFGGLANVILRSNQIHLKAYQISFPTSLIGLKLTPDEGVMAFPMK
jgi:hypothetical protein